MTLVDKIVDYLKQEVTNTFLEMVDDTDFNLGTDWESKKILEDIQKIVEDETQRLEQLKEACSYTLTEAIVEYENMSVCSDIDDSYQARCASIAGWLKELREYRRVFKEEVFLPTT